MRQQRGVPLAEEREHPVRREVDVARQVLVPLRAEACRALHGEQGRLAFLLVRGEGGGESVLARLGPAQGVGQGDGVLEGERGARADGVVRGVGGVAEQDEVAPGPGAVGEGEEVAPPGAGAAAGVCAADQPVPVEQPGEESFEERQPFGLPARSRPSPVQVCGEHSTTQVLASWLKPYA